MSIIPTNRTKWLTVRLTPDEFQRLKNLSAQSTERHLSDYARRVLLRKPIVQRTKNASLDAFLLAIEKLNPNLDKIRNTLTASLKKLNDIREITDIHQWIFQNEQDKTRVFQEINTIKTLINQSYKLWSQK